MYIFETDKWRYVTVYLMVEYMNNGVLEKDMNNQANYYDIHSN